MSDIKEFKILDLFCGAGGFSYGMHKNKHFTTVIALDFNEQAANTFKRNMPFADVVIGDIKESSIRKRVLKDGKRKKSEYDYRWSTVPRLFFKRKKVGAKRPKELSFFRIFEIC